MVVEDGWNRGARGVERGWKRGEKRRKGCKGREREVKEG